MVDDTSLAKEPRKFAGNIFAMRSKNFRISFDKRGKKMKTWPLTEPLKLLYPSQLRNPTSTVEYARLSLALCSYSPLIRLHEFILCSSSI